jgi:plastocyanin
VLQHYVFVPSTIHAPAGKTITIYNSDQILHRIVGDDGSFDTGVMVPGSSFTLKAGAPGTTISYHCVLHSRVKGQVVVDLTPVHRRVPPETASPGIGPIFPPETK